MELARNPIKSAHAKKVFFYFYFYEFIARSSTEYKAGLTEAFLEYCNVCSPPEPPEKLSRERNVNVCTHPVGT